MAQTPTPSIPVLPLGGDTGRSDTDGITNIATPTLSGTATPGATITLYDSDGVTALTPTGTADANGHWSIAVLGNLDDGFHEITAVATLAGEDASAHSPPLALVVDTTVPDPPTAPALAAADDTGMSALDGVTSAQILHLSGQTEPNALVQLYNGSDGPVLASAIADSSGKYTLVTGSLADGSYNLAVTATDVAGNVSKPSGTTAVTVDTAKPAAPAGLALAPGSDTGALRTDGLTNDTTPVFVGTAEANATVSLYDQNAGLIGKGQADASGNFTITATAPLSEGAHALLAVAADAAGNLSAQSQQLNIDVETAPDTATIAPASITPVLGTVQFTVHFSSAVTGLTRQDLAVLTTGSATGSVDAVSGSGTEYTVSVDGITGSGNVQLALASGSALTDAAGNPVTLASSTALAVATADTPQAVPVETIGGGSDDAIGLSAGGRLVAFDSGDVLTDGASGAASNVYIKDVLTGGLSLVSGGLAGAIADGAAGYPALSANGRTIVFVSTASNLVAGGPTDGSANVYVAHLSTANLQPGQAVTVTSIQLVSTGNGHDGIGASTAFTAPAISADGTHVAFISDQPLIAGVQPGSNVYEEDLTTGALTLVSAGTDGTGVAFAPGGFSGAAATQSVSLSQDGSLVAYLSNADNLDDSVAGGGSGVVRSYVTDTATGATTAFYGADQLGLTGAGGDLTVSDLEPSISANGQWLTYVITREDPGTGDLLDSFAVVQNLSTGAIQLVSPDTPGLYANFPTINTGGRYVTYASTDSNADPGDPDGNYLFDTVSGETTVLGNGSSPFLSADGNAVANTTPPNAGGESTVTLTTLGPVVNVDPVGDDGVFGTQAWAQVQQTGLLVSGTCNDAGTDNFVRLTLSDAHGTVLDTISAIPVTNGAWSTTLPASDLQGLADGTYLLSAASSSANGASFPSGPAFTVDTAAPATPDAPKLEVGSDTGTAHDGTVTDQDTPVLTGTAEAGATITLYDTTSASPTTPIGTATADANGVYAITPDAALADGTYSLTITATDAAGNVSSASDALTLKVDTVAPAKPGAPALQPAPTGEPPFAGSSFGTPAPAATGSDTGSSDSDGITSNATPTLVGTAGAGDTVTLYDTDGVSVLGTATATATGSYAITPGNALAEGAHTLTVTDTDAAGNVSAASSGLQIVIDTLPPLAPAITNVAGVVVNGNQLGPIVDVTGKAEPGSTVTLALNGGTTDFGSTTADAEGDFTLTSDVIPPGPQDPSSSTGALLAQKLTVTATDVAGNTSQASLPVYVNITANPVPPPGTPPGAALLQGVLTDGPIVGATVFADANGNGVLDPGEAATTTGSDGSFALYAATGDLEAIGGTDTTTGRSLPGPLFAPAGSTVINPLTTLLDVFMAQTGDALATANAAVTAALGLGSGTDLTTLDPYSAATAGSASLDGSVADGTPEVLSAQLADLVTDYADAIDSYDGLATPANVSADAFQAIAAKIAALPSGGTIDLTDQTLLLDLVQATAASAGVGAGDEAAIERLDTLEDSAAQIVGAGNQQLAQDLAQSSGQALLTAIANTESVEQGPAAAALQQIAANSSLAATLVPQYTGAPLTSAVAADVSLIIGAPYLAPASDGGVSDRDELTDTATPTFMGEAVPGTFVTLVLVQNGSTGEVLGSGQADASGHYSITSAPLPEDTQDSPNTYGGGLVAALGSMTDPDLADGAIVTLPQGVQEQGILTDSTGADGAYIARTQSISDAAGDGGSALLVEVGAFSDGTVQVFADGGTTPIASGTILNASEDVALLTTTPLAPGMHTLTVVETLVGGTVLAPSAPSSVNVTADDTVSGVAEVVGPLVGATVTQDELIDIADSPELVPTSTTDGNGAFQVSSDPRLPNSAIVADGYDAVTGLPLTGFYASLSPAELYGNDAYDNSVILRDDGIQGFLEVPGSGGSAGEGDGDDGSPGSVPTADPLAAAEAGDPAALLATIELFDTASIFAAALGPLDTAPFDGVDLDDANALVTAVNDAYPSGLTINDQGTVVTPDDLAALAGIAATLNADLDAYAATATSAAAILSYAFASERLAQETITQAIYDAGFDAGSPDPTALSAIASAYSGTNLAAAIASALGDTTEATSFVPDGPASTGAASVGFTITFSRAVTGLTAASFALAETGGLQGASVTGVAAIAGSAGTEYEVTVATGIGSGGLTLSYLGDGVQTATGAPITSGTLAPVQVYRPLVYFGTEAGIVTGDFNGDGKPDAILFSTGAHAAITPFMNDGNGQFTAEGPLSTYTGAGVNSQAAADVNGDGRLDLVLASGSFITVLTGNGDGTFGQPINTPIGFTPSQLVTGDFNGDGRTDVAVADYGGNKVHILLGNGAGGFTEIGSDAVGNTPVALVAADFNGDGKTDLAVANRGDNTVSILLGNGDGSFTPASTPTVAVGTYPDGIAAADLNGDGKIDLVVADGVSNDVTILLGNGQGGFTAGQTISFAIPGETSGAQANFDPEAIAIGDLNDDGIPDLVVTGDNGGPDVLLGNGDGTFRPWEQNSVTAGVGGVVPAVALADVNGDGRLDALVAAEDQSPFSTDSDGGLGVLLNEAQPVVGSTSPTVTIDRPAAAQPVLSEASGGGTLTQSGDSYTLDLGQLAQGEALGPLLFSLANAAAAGADSFDGTFSAPSGDGFAVTGAMLAQAVAAGGSYGGLSVTADTSALGAHSTTLTFAPRDVAATAAPDADIDGEDGAVPAAATPAATTALELPAITLTVTDTVVAGTAQPPAALGVSSAPVMLPNVRVGDPDSQALSVSNMAAAGAAGLDVTASSSGDATASGSVVGLAPGATDGTDLSVGLGTAAAGAQSGTVTLEPVSDGGAALAAVPVTVSGSVFRTAQATITATSPIVHVGDPGTVSLSVTNSAATDGFSEALEAAITATSGAATAASTAPTAAIAPGAADASLSLTLPTTTAGVESGSATLGLTSDGGTGPGSIDGLGTLALAAQEVDVTLTVDNYASAAITQTGGAGTLTAGPDGLVLDFGTVAQGSAALTADLAITNSASGPADLLAGDLSETGDAAITAAGLAAFAGLAAGQADDAPTVSLSTATAGSFSATLTLSPTGSNASGYSGELPTQTLIIRGTVTPATTPPPAAPVTTPATLTVAADAPATAIGIPTPTDPAYDAAQLSATVTALPDDGTVALADGGAAVTLGQVLSATQLAGLTFLPAAGDGGQSSSFGYTVTDPAGASAAGIATLAVTATSTGTLATPVITTPNEIIDTPTPTILGTAASGSTVTLFDAAGDALGSTVAAADGSFAATVASALPLGASSLTATASNGSEHSAASNALGVFTVESPDADGVVRSDFNSLQIGTVLGQGYALSFLPQTEALVTVDGTLSVQDDTEDAFVTRLYQGLLGRAPDAAGASFWHNLLYSGDSHAALASAFMTTAEYQADHPASSDQDFVTSLYQGLLGRTPDPAGAAYYTAQLASGVSRGAVAAFIADSAEAKAYLAPVTPTSWVASPFGTMVYEAYQTGLDQEVDRPTLQTALQALRGGESPADFFTQLANSPAFLAQHASQSNADYVTSLYQAGLGRTPDTGGAAFYANLLTTGTGTRASVLQEIATSTEATAHLTRTLVTA